VGYAAASNGALTALPGSPYTADVSWLAVNARYVFGADKNGVNVDSYRIEANGALTMAAQTDVATLSPNDCGYSGALFLDHSGSSLYDLDYRDDCANNDFRSLSVVKSTGDLRNLGATSGNSWLTEPATFIGNNEYAYTASCLGDMYWGIWGFKREGNGLLTDLKNFMHAMPAPPSNTLYCPSNAAADPTNHVAIAMQPADNSSFTNNGPAQIATFTAESNGNLSTTSTSANMPSTAVGSVTDMSMAPSGRLLAVSGTSGLQVFHFNGANPATPDTGLLTHVEIDQMFWDNENHLYAISRTAGALYVFTVTPTSVSQAPGSPYAITAPQNVTVRPLTLRSAK
jgi:hypothetical protein